MKVLQIAFKDVEILFKDKRTVLLIILMPIVLIFVLGLSLNSLFTDDEANIQKASLVVIDKDNTELSKEIMNFFEGDSIKKYVKNEKLTEDEAKEKINKGQLTALIVIPKGYEQEVSKNKKTDIRLYLDKGSPVGSSIIRNILETYASTSNIALNAGLAAEDKYQEFSLNGNMIIQDIVSSIADQEDVIRDGTLTVSGSGITAMQYYSAAMVSMYILFVGMLGTSLLIDEREGGTLSRLLTTNTRKATIVAGKVLGMFLVGLLDVAILLLFTKFVYKVDWGNSFIGLLLLTVSMTFAASGLSVFISTLFKDSKTVDIVNPAIILIMSFVGGNMFPLYEMSEMLRKISKVLMNNWSLRGYLSLMINGGVSSVLMSSFVLIGMGVLFLGIGIKKLKI